MRRRWEARLVWVQDGALRQRTSAEYIAGFTGRPAPDEAQRNRRIESVDISGTAASARIVLDYPAVRFGAARTYTRRRTGLGQAGVMR